MEKNLTTGSIFKNIILFSLPFLLSSFLQTLYGLVDLFVIGLYCEKAATTAVSCGSQIMHVLTVMIIGLAMGSTVLIGRSVGARDKETRNEAIGNTITLFAGIAVVMTVVLLLLTMPIVHIMSTPEEAVAGTFAYLRICFAGLPFIIAYNVVADIFRGMGDSKTPLYFVIIACICNIVLDFVFIGALGMGPSGAAFATVIAQAVSVITALGMILRMHLIDGLTRRHLIPVGKVCRTMLGIGIPVTAQNAFIQFSFILITVLANRRGINDAAAVGIVEKIISFLFLVPSSLLSSVSALCAQNIGAGLMDRARRTLYEAAALAVGYGMILAVLFQFIAPQAVGIFTKDTAVIALGASYMYTYVIDTIFAGFHFPCSGYFSACGHSELAFLHNFASIVLARIPIAYFAATHCPGTLLPLGLAAPTGSLISCVICFVALRVLRKHEKNHFQSSEAAVQK